MKSLLCFQCFYGKCAVGFLHIYMCCGRDWSTQIVVEKSFLFSKNTRTANLDRRSFSRDLLSYFSSLLLVILKNFGHTGIAGTKK